MTVKDTAGATRRIKYFLNLFMPAISYPTGKLRFPISNDLLGDEARFELSCAVRSSVGVLSDIRFTGRYVETSTIIRSIIRNFRSTNGMETPEKATPRAP